MILDDDSGQAVVDPVSEWDLSFDSGGGAGLWGLPESREMRGLLESMGVSTDSPGWQDEVRIHEAVCAIGEPVVVVARGHWEIDTARSAGGYRESGRRLRLGPMDMERLVITDDRRMLRRSR